MKAFIKGLLKPVLPFALIAAAAAVLLYYVSPTLKHAIVGAIILSGGVVAVYGAVEVTWAALGMLTTTQQLREREWSGDYGIDTTVANQIFAAVIGTVCIAIGFVLVAVGHFVGWWV